MDKLLGRTSSKTLTLTHRPATGLEATVDLPDTELGRETAVLVARNDLQGCSFSFRAGTDNWLQDGDGQFTRVVQSISHLGDVSVCTLPTYQGTSVWVRSAEQPDDEWLVAAAARDRQLRLVKAEAGIVETRSTWGKPIAPPSWWKPARGAAWRSGCGHLLLAGNLAESAHAGEFSPVRP